MKSSNAEDLDTVRKNSNQSQPVKGRKVSANDNADDKKEIEFKSQADKGKSLSSQWQMNN